MAFFGNPVVNLEFDFLIVSIQSELYDDTLCYSIFSRFGQFWPVFGQFLAFKLAWSPMNCLHYFATALMGLYVKFYSNRARITVNIQLFPFSHHFHAALKLS